jgi:hypothetical protein
VASLKKLLLGVAVLFALLLAAYLTADFVVNAATRRVIDHVRAEGNRHGVRVLDFLYEDALFVLPATVYWTGVEATAHVETQSFLPHGKDVELKIEKASFHMDSFSERTFRLRMRDIMINVLDRREDAPPNGTGKALNMIKGKEATVHFKVKSLTPNGIARLAEEAAGGLRDFFLTGRSSLPISFSGVVSFPRDGKVLHSRIMVERRDGSSTLVMDEEDVVIISRKLNLETPLTSAEAKLVSRNPLKAHRLFQVRTYARSRSTDAHRSDSAVPEDAYRHVLWSYLLTKEFGEVFAEEVTDAHEKGNTGNTGEERLMDINNNEIGREYALRGRDEQELLKLTLTDPRVLRKPSSPGPEESAGEKEPL